jgi:PTS system cellobiose-specific IIB component
VKRVLIVCGAGASSTFLALRMRKAASGRGIALQVSAGSVDDLSDQLAVVDAILVGPHLAEQFDEVKLLANARGVGAGLLPADVFGAEGVDRAFDTLAEIADPAVTSAKHPQNTESLTPPN